MQTYQQAPTPELKAAALRNVAYVGVAARLQNLNDSLPDPALPMVRRELELIREHKEFREGAILPYAIDYTQFQVRGHYTRTATLQRYFRAMMWYGLFPFAPRRLMPGRTTEPTPMPVRQALLLTDALYRANLVNEWQQLMTPIDFFVGAWTTSRRPKCVRRRSASSAGTRRCGCTPTASGSRGSWRRFASCGCPPFARRLSH